MKMFKIGKKIQLLLLITEVAGILSVGSVSLFFCIWGDQFVLSQMALNIFGGTGIIAGLILCIMGYGSSTDNDCIINDASVVLEEVEGINRKISIFFKCLTRECSFRK